MDNEGYVYLLANSAMPDLVKVGKTQRSSLERARELSASTALPTPFIVVYECFFADCAAAETYIHTMLEKKGARESSKREFFRASPQEVIEIMIATPGRIFLDRGNASHQDNELSIKGTSSKNAPMDSHTPENKLYPWLGIWEQAERAYYGDDGVIKDYGEALQLYLQAARLKCPMAYRKIGDMYLFGKSVKENEQKALEFYKKGAREGDYYSYINMALMFLRSDLQENHEKALKLFFKARNEGINTVVEQDKSFLDIVFFYIRVCFKLQRNPPYFISKDIREIKFAILARLLEEEEEYIDAGDDEELENVQSAISWIEEFL